MSEKFKKQELSPLLNPVDWFNFYGSFISIFEGNKTVNIISETEVGVAEMGVADIDQKNRNKPTFILKGYTVEVKKNNLYNLAIGAKLSKFMLLSAVKFKGDNYAAQSYVNYYLMKCEVPYIRVGTDYFKIIYKTDRYNGKNQFLKPWKKDEIKEDHSKQIFSKIFRYDDFTIHPNNKEYVPVIGSCYNLYCKFTHQQQSDCKVSDIPITLGLLKHVFGEQLNLGLQYMKILYEHPKQILPILTLVSTERETGKTTFLNYIQMLFGENTSLINPSNLTSDYNDSYATKNIVMVDETVIDKQTTVEKLKSIATAKSMSVSQKFVAHYSIPFFGKIILCTNKEKDFARIDDEEIRFWIRKIKPIQGKKNTNIENDLFSEIPFFLKYLSDLPEIDFSRSRMVFTSDEIKTESLDIVKEESKSSLHKEIEELLEDFFNNYQIPEFEATVKDIKDRWFSHNHQISMAYIRKVLKDEMKMEASKPKRYKRFGNNEDMSNPMGNTFTFKNQNSIKNQLVSVFDEEDTF